MNGQTLKATLQSRVINAQTERLSSQRQNLGEGLTCPAGSGNIHHDVYGRPVTQNTLDLRDSACSHYLIDASEFMQYETNHRPHLPICAAGLRGASDMAGWGRDLLPQNLYNEGYNPALGDDQDLGISGATSNGHSPRPTMQRRTRNGRLPDSTRTRNGSPAGISE